MEYFRYGVDFLYDVYSVPREKIELLPLGVDDDAIPSNKEEIKNDIRNKLRNKDYGFSYYHRWENRSFKKHT